MTIFRFGIDPTELGTSVELVARAVVLARDLTNTTSLEKCPQWLADRASGLASDAGLTVRVRDEVVLFGEQDGEAISAWDWAERLDTIAYEIVCGIAINRVPRRYGP